MSSTYISPHIPDLNLITYYAEKKENYFSRISPWTKFCTLVLLVLFVTLSRNLVMLAGTYAVVLLAFALAHLPVKKLFAWSLIPIFFVISLVGIMAWTQPGVPVFSFPLPGFELTLTDQGILLVVTLTLKTLISVSFSLLVLMTTRYEHLSGMISRIFPSPLDQIFLMAYRFLFLTISMIGSMLKAVRSRGGGLMNSIKTQGRLLAEIFGMVFIRSFDRAERVHKAMIARGYNGSYSTAIRIPPPGIFEYLFLALYITLIGLSTWHIPLFGVVMPS
jgi:cobalt/nickel transport system permease protein